MKKGKTTILLCILSFIILLSNCGQKKNEPDANVELDSPIVVEGRNILDKYCISCHSPAKGMKNRIAPPLVAMKDHYLKPGMKEEVFVDNVTSFLLAPAIENSQMPGAIKRFGLMPKMGLSKEQYDAVGTYLFRTQMDSPDWYKEHTKEERKEMMKYAEAGTEDYLKKGMNLALATKAILGKNLLTAIQTQGSHNAVGFCNERAIPLTDSMSVILNAEIRRVSDYNRNPDNAANAVELAYINQAKLEISNKGKASPKMQEIDDQMVGYYPIMTNGMCLQCHGVSGSDIDDPTLEVIKEKYPADKAVGYLSDELRGIWVVTMDKE